MAKCIGFTVEDNSDDNVVILECYWNTPINMRAWNNLEIECGYKEERLLLKKVMHSFSLVQWLAWHLPYGLMRRWR